MFPQELVDAIVSYVDAESLAASSLVSPAFCAASQRLLFRAVKLEGTHYDHSATRSIGSNYSRAYALLSDSPHLIPYITHLTIHLPIAATYVLDEIDDLRRVLPKLARVRYCVLYGAHVRGHWSEYPSWFTAAVFEFLSRQHLHTLRVSELDEITAQALLSFITAAPKVEFFYNSIQSSSAKLSATCSHIPPTLTELCVGDRSDALSELLSHPQFAEHTAKLQRLSVRFLKEPPMNLFSAVSHTLTHLSLDCRGFKDSTFSASFPPLPKLCSLNLVLDTAHPVEPWFIDSISQIFPFNSNFAPQDIILSFDGMEKHRADEAYIPILKTLETLLISLSTVPRLVWRLGYCRSRGFADFPDLVDFLQRATPTLHLLEKVVVENFMWNWWDKF